MSKARLLTAAEQLKLASFRRFLRSAGVTYHDLVERVETARRDAANSRGCVVDEDGLAEDHGRKRRSKNGGNR
jgi:hypothetical protein